MRRIYVSLLACLLTCGSSRGAFTDVEGYPYRDSIDFLADRDIVKGYPDGSYGVDRDITRAELLKIILEAKKPSDLIQQTDCFPDVHDERYAQYVCYAKDHQIIRGYPDGTFKPEQTVTIAEALKIALESFGTSAEEGNGNDRYQPYLEFVHDNTIFSKFALHPHMPMSRGRMAHLVHRLLLDLEKTKEFTGVRDNRSPGCGQNQPRTTPTSSVVNGLTRTYITVIGDEYDEDEPIPLIFAFHGRTNPNSMVRTYYKVEQATRGDAIMIYPAGLPEEGPSRSRSNPGDKASQLRDFQLFDQLVAEFGDQYCIDMDQIYVVGHSLGAWFTNSLACARGDVIRAIGSVGGSTTKNACSGPTAAVIMQHPEDNLSSYGAGVVARDQLLKQNGCGPATRAVGPEIGHCVEYTDCLTDAPVIRCEHSDAIDHRGVYYPHKRPEFAGKYIWDFFQSLQK